MDRRQVARVLEEMAAMLEIKGENPFKIRAYENGARAVLGMQEDLGEAVRTGTLRQVQGIGAGLSANIEALVRTGSLPYYEELGGVPPGLRECIRVPGYADASISTVPPATDPVPSTENGRRSPSICTPRPRNASSSTAIGRVRACSSPSKVTVWLLTAATGGTKRSTVPARPKSTRAPGCGVMAPLIVSSESAPSTATPSACNAPIIRSVSRLRSAPLRVDDPCGVARAASTSARLVCDFEPGTVTVA